MTHPSAGMKWFRCKGCGAPCGIGPAPYHLVAHAKPAEYAGIPGTVPCELFRRCESREFFVRFMQGEPLPDPTDVHDVPPRRN